MVGWFPGYPGYPALAVGRLSAVCQGKFSRGLTESFCLGIPRYLLAQSEKLLVSLTLKRWKLRCQNGHHACCEAFETKPRGIGTGSKDLPGQLEDLMRILSLAQGIDLDDVIGLE